MNERISYIIKSLGIKKVEFAESLNVSGGFVSQLCSGVSTPSDRTIADICRIFNVNEAWLRTGIGEPFIQLSREEEIASILGSAIAGGTAARDRLIRALARLPDDAFPIIEAAILAAAEELQKEKPE
jgi:transcriptional regulator with XRE-family HTH domain